MNLRVHTPTTTQSDRYDDAASYYVDNHGQLNVMGPSGRVATYHAECWASVTVDTSAVDIRADERERIAEQIEAGCDQLTEQFGACDDCGAIAAKVREGTPKPAGSVPDSE